MYYTVSCRSYAGTIHLSSNGDVFLRPRSGEAPIGAICDLQALFPWFILGVCSQGEHPPCYQDRHQFEAVEPNPCGEIGPGNESQAIHPSGIGRREAIHLDICSTLISAPYFFVCSSPSGQFYALSLTVSLREHYHLVIL